MKEDKPNPCLSLLKDHQYCDFYEAVYLFGCNNPNKLNDLLKVAYIDPEINDIKSISGFNECQREFILRRVTRYEHTIDFGTSSFPPNERKVVNFLDALWKKLLILEKDKPKGFDSLFFPLPSKIIEFQADIHVEGAFGFRPHPSFKFFHFQDLIHEIIFSNKMLPQYCSKLEINQTMNDEYVAYSIKARNLVIRTVAHYLLSSKSELKWNLQSVIDEGLMKLALEIFVIPKSSVFRLLKDEIKKVIPENLVRAGGPHCEKWNSKELSMKPLLISEGFISDSEGNLLINYQVVRIILRTLILAHIHDNKLPTVNEILQNPLVEFYISKLSLKGLNFCKSEVARYLQFQK